MFKSTTVTLAAIALAVLLPQPGQGCDDLRPGPAGRVVAVPDGDTVVLDTGDKVRLIGIQAPKLALGREGFAAWPMAEDARDALRSLVLGKAVELRYGGRERDRYGRVLAHMFVAGDAEIWAQREMLQKGMARVYTFADNRSCLAELYAAEAAARAARRGIWASDYYAIRAADRPDALANAAGHYEVVEGRVLTADRAGSLVYLNFGRVWKRDFTVVIDRAGQKLFAESGIDPLTYEGRFIRVRGWIEQQDGPRMSISHPEQVEVLAVR